MSPHPFARLLLLIPLTLGWGQVVMAQGSAKLGSPSIAREGVEAEPDPGSLFGHPGKPGDVLRFLVIGDVRGGVWGDGVYTSDSILSAAAVHAGLLTPGRSGIVSLEIVAGPSSYEGTTRNGVTSRAYGAWEIAYRFIGVEPVDDPAVLSDPGNLTAYRGRDGTVLTFEVTGAADGRVWGDGIYTDDSVLAAAAVHAGLLGPGETGKIAVEILPGQGYYPPSHRNGISSAAFGAWGGSYRVLPALGREVSSKLSN